MQLLQILGCTLKVVQLLAANPNTACKELANQRTIEDFGQSFSNGLFGSSEVSDLGRQFFVRIERRALYMGD